MTSIILGCPVYNREWILPQYLQAIENSYKYYKQSNKDLELSLLFITSKDDIQDIKILEEAKGKPFNINLILLDQIANQSSKRTWNIQRYDMMTMLRNKLLDEVRKIQPDYYLENDSDIILNENTLVNLIRISKLIQEKGQTSKIVLSPLVNLASWGPSKCWNFMFSKGNNKFSRENSSSFVSSWGKEEYKEVDVGLACKFFSKESYQNFEYSVYKYKRDNGPEYSQGEELGSALLAKQKGIKYFIYKEELQHIMSPDQLNKIK